MDAVGCTVTIFMLKISLGRFFCLTGFCILVYNMLNKRTES